MLFRSALASLLLLSGSAAAFSVEPSSGKKALMTPAASKTLASGLAAGVIAAATLVPLPGPAQAADSLVIGTPLEAKLANFGAASYPVFNSISDVSPLADKFIDFVDSKVKADDAADVVNKAVDGLMAIPDAKVAEYGGILKKDVYTGVAKNSCVTLGGSEALGKKLAASAAVRSVPPSKLEALEKKFAPANKEVVTKDGNLCLPGSPAASEKLWVAQAELTLSMPKEQAGELVASIKKAGAQATRPSLLTLVGSAEGVFSKSPEALKMVTAGKDVEPTVISTVQAALR